MPFPGLIVIGGQKCGTSTLHSALASHQSLRPATHPETDKVVKEVNFFGNHWDKGVPWYQSHFRHTEGIGLEATPNYLCDIHAHERLAAVVPNAKLVVSLRDPIARACSQFNHYSQKIETTKDWDWWLPGDSFAANVKAELEEPKRRWYGIVARGYYLQQLKHVLKYFPREQVHIMIMERWISDPDRHYNELLEFAELPRQSLDKRIVHMREYTVDDLDEETRSQLAEIYRPHNERLFEWLGESIEQWGDYG